MPSGRTHDILTAIGTPIVAFISEKYFNSLQDVIVLTSAFLFSSLMFNGDLDIKSRPYNRWLFFKWIWIPYRNMFGHRSIWTHGIIIGTIVRLLYLVPLFILIWGMVFNFAPLIINWYFIILILIGLELGNSIHTISDKLYSL